MSIDTAIALLIGVWIGSIAGFIIAGLFAGGTRDDDDY